MHSEILVKVNAWVDEEVAPLVAALNQFEGVQTLDSCQGQENAQPYVYFVHREGEQKTIALVQALSTLLTARLHSCCHYRIRLEWTGETERPLAEIVTRREYVSTLANALAEIAASDCRRSQSGDGR